MRLADFIEANVELILAEWEGFARHIWPGEAIADPAELRDEAGDILRATVEDMRSSQTAEQQTAKSKGLARPDRRDSDLTLASDSHGSDRAASGFELWAVIAEYRALRASVLRLWRESRPDATADDIDDLTRFNESIDESLTHAVRTFGARVEEDRAALLAREQAARQDAEGANRAKDLFLATLSHEMRTPLNSIVGWVSILRHEGGASAHFEEGLSIIERNTRAQVQLIDDLLDVSRIVSGKLRMTFRPCDLAEVIDAGVGAVRTAAQARGITLHVELDPSASRAMCDSVRIQQVVWNLVSNAVKFTSKGGRVDITLRREQSSYEIHVSDTGQGIATDLLPHVFDRFRQADSSSRRRHGGLGLGLSIVKYIVEAHGGTVEAASAGVGHGSTFTVRLPVQAVRVHDPGDAAAAGEEGPSESADARERSPVRLDGLRVLVVDDEADARQVLAMVLQRVGAEVTVAHSARAALDTLSQTPADVLVSDIGMPTEDGFDLIRHLRRGLDANRLPAIALTAFVQKEDAHLALQAGYQIHLPKPVDPHDLTSAIARLVRPEQGA